MDCRWARWNCFGSSHNWSRGPKQSPSTCSHLRRVLLTGLSAFTKGKRFPLPRDRPRPRSLPSVGGPLALPDQLREDSAHVSPLLWDRLGASGPRGVPMGGSAPAGRALPTCLSNLLGCCPPGACGTGSPHFSRTRKAGVSAGEQVSTAGQGGQPGMGSGSRPPLHGTAAHSLPSFLSSSAPVPGPCPCLWTGGCAPSPPLLHRQEAPLSLGGEEGAGWGRERM